MTTICVCLLHVGFCFGIVTDTVGQHDIAKLRQELTHPDARTRQRAAQSLGIMGSEAKSAVPDLILLLKDESVNVRRAAANSIRLIGIGGDSVPALLRALKDSDSTVRSSIAGALGALGESAKSSVAELTKLLSDEAAEVRCAAALSLWQINRETTKTVQVLRKALDSSEMLLRMDAIDKLGLMGKDAANAVDEIRAALADKNPIIQCYAAHSLWLITRDTNRVLAVFSKLVENEDEDPSQLFNTRILALQFLGEIGSDAKPTVRGIMSALKSQNSETRCEAAIALWSITHNTELTIPVLSKIVHDEELDEITRSNAVATLGEMGTKAAGVLQDVRGLLQDESDRIRKAAKQAIDKIDKLSGNTPNTSE